MNRLDEAPRAGGFYAADPKGERFVDANGVEVPAEDVSDSKKQQEKVSDEFAAQPAPAPVGRVIMDESTFRRLTAQGTATTDEAASRSSASKTSGSRAGSAEL